VTVNNIKVCEGLPAAGFPSPTSKGGRPVPNPAAGNGNDSNLNNTGSNGNYWSSTPNSDNSNNAWNLNFNLSRFGKLSDDGLRYYPNVLDWAGYGLRKGNVQ